MMYYDAQLQGLTHNLQSNPQQGASFPNPQIAHAFGAWPSAPMLQGIGYGLGQAGYGQQYGQQQYGQYGGQQYGPFGGQPSLGAFGYAGWGGQQPHQGWGQRQLSQQDVSEVVRQLLPVLPQIIAQAQQPNPALAYAAYGQYGQAPRLLTQQDVNEVVRQLLPVVPQIVGMLQGQPQLQHAMYGGSGQWGQGYPNIAGQSPYGMPQPWSGQHGSPQFQSAFGGPQQWGQQPRQLTQQDVNEVTRQLVGLIPQVIGNLQALNQQRVI